MTEASAREVKHFIPRASGAALEVESQAVHER